MPQTYSGYTIPAYTDTADAPAAFIDLVDDIEARATGIESATSEAIALVPPPGSIMAYGGTSAPSGYFLCNGQAVSRSTYAALFNVIGVRYGGGDGSTTFQVPNLVGRVPVGFGDNDFGTALGYSGGSKTSTARHTHGVTHDHANQQFTVSDTNLSHRHSMGHEHGRHYGSTYGADGNHQHQLYIADDPFTQGTGASRTRKGYANPGNVSEWGGSHQHSVWVDIGAYSGDTGYNGTNNIWNHNHTVDVNLSSISVTSDGSSAASTTGADTGNMPPYLTVNYIIKH